ncbi:MAG: hypothetical protein JNK52_14675 [Zoogloeaceae bacterium]|nr:hypothetical protein [Zoogloeaceae bacterium]
MEATCATPEQFLAALELSVTELAALRGVSRQYATRDLAKFITNTEALSDLYRTLLVINTDSSRVMAERLRRFSVEELQLELNVGSTVAISNTKTHAQLFAENKELWIWSASPLDMERTGFWEKLCSEFLDKDGRLLAYFVPTLEIAERLALRFEQELIGRAIDGQPSTANVSLFGATIFIIVTQLAAPMPYMIVANPGSADFSKEGLLQTAWALEKHGQMFFELPNGFGDQLVQKVRGAGLGVARVKENFFPMGVPLGAESGIPFGSYPNVDHLVATRLEFSIGLFDGLIIDHTKENAAAEQRQKELKHPLKFFPAFIRAYRRKPYQSAKTKPQAKGAKPAELFDF